MRYSGGHNAMIQHWNRRQAVQPTQVLHAYEASFDQIQANSGPGLDMHCLSLPRSRNEAIKLFLVLRHSCRKGISPCQQPYGWPHPPMGGAPNVTHGTNKGGHSSEGKWASNVQKPIVKRGNPLGGGQSNPLHRDVLCS